jgi:hypothetical protein
MCRKRGKEQALCREIVPMSKEYQQGSDLLSERLRVLRAKSDELQRVVARVRDHLTAAQEERE